MRISDLDTIAANTDLVARESSDKAVLIGVVAGGYKGIPLGNTDSEIRRTGVAVVEVTAKLRWTATNVQGAVGAAGGASAPAATPAKWLKVVGDNSITYVIPAYTAKFETHEPRRHPRPDFRPLPADRRRH